MTRTVVTVGPGEPVLEAARRLAERGISAVPVVENGMIVGVLSESDILRAIAPAPHKDRPSLLEVFSRRTPGPRRSPALVREVMSRKVVTVSPDDGAWQAAALMRRNNVKRLPVTDVGNRLAGIISRADLIRAMARPDRSIEADVLHVLDSLGTPSSGIEVYVDTGIVVLTGTAPDSAVIRAAVDLAGRVAGVESVNDHVRRAVAPDITFGEPDVADLDVFVDRRSRR